jgi:hypothetical protein
MTFGIAMILAIFIPVIGILMLAAYKLNIYRKIPLNICRILCVLSICVYVSFLFAPTKHYNSKFYYKEYSIDKVTFSSVYFNNDSKNFGESSNIILEEPNKEYSNVVIVEYEDYSSYWLLGRIDITGAAKYHIYLSKDVYQRYEDKNVIYKK